MLVAIKRQGKSVQSIEATETALILSTEHGNIKIEPYSDAIIRVVYTLEDAFSTISGLGVSPNTKQCTWSYRETNESITIKTSKIEIVIDKQTCAFSYFDNSGKLLTKEPATEGKVLDAFPSYKTILDEDSLVEKIETPDGVKEVVKEAKKEFDQTLYHEKLYFEWDENEALYGLGQQEDGIFNLRGTRRYIHQANMKIAIPFLISTNGYGILLDTYSPVIFNDNEYGSYLYSEAVKEMDFYFIVGETFDHIISGYRQITGKATMLPRWAFGYMQSLERYETQQEIIDTVKEYRKRQIPLDTIILDWQSWEEGLWGQKTFDLSRFPKPKQMTDTLHEDGAHFMISVWPNMNKESDNYKEMQSNSLLFQKSETYDAFNAEARELYWRQANDGLFSQGVDAWWCDSSEPFCPEWSKGIEPEPDANYREYHDTAKAYVDEAVTNAFTLMHARTMYEGQRSSTDEKRVVNLTRSGYTGQQKYGTIVWSGDISANWTTLKNQIPAGLNLCVAGLPYWTLDIGAFFVKKGVKWFWNGDYEAGNEDLGYRELYTRWLQYGAFLPVFRSHGTDTRREIWQFGEEGEMFYDTIAKFIKLRYALLPYIYSMAGMVYLKDYTIMRLLAFDFKNDKNVYNIKDQYMFGDAFMICPVTTPMYYQSNSQPIENVDKKRPVYLPAGADWYDYWTNEKYTGGQCISANAEIDIMPIYIKAGSIVPMVEVAQHSEASSEKEIELMIYPRNNAQFTLYQDENNNYNYENGSYATIEITWDDESKCLVFDERVGSFKGMSETIIFTINVIGHEKMVVEYNSDKLVLE